MTFATREDVYRRIMTLAQLRAFVREIARRPHAVISGDPKTGTLRVRFLGVVSPNEERRIEEAIEAQLPVYMVLETSWEEPPFDLDALATDVVLPTVPPKEGAIDVLVDALLEVGILDGERDRSGSDDPDASRAVLQRRAREWAEEAIPLPAPDRAVYVNGRFVSRDATIRVWRDNPMSLFRNERRDLLRVDIERIESPEASIMLDHAGRNREVLDVVVHSEMGLLVGRCGVSVWAPNTCLLEGELDRVEPRNA